MTQDKALEILKGDSNVFLTGQPGAGKTYTINQYIDWLVDNGRTPTITASTGIAAVHVSGQTIHSWAGLRDDKQLTDIDIDDILGNSYTLRRMTQAEVLIIDEISMVSAELLNNVERLTRAARQNPKPFGGIKVILVGDFFQLPPVKGAFAFESAAWDKANFQVCYLHEQHRQDDKVFNDILTGIRAGHLEEDQKQIIRDKVISDASGMDGVIRLETHNNAVDRMNQMKLERLAGTLRTYEMDSRGNDKAIKALKANCLSPERLILKVGAPVLFTRNDKDLRWVNGTQGKVVEMDTNMVKVEIGVTGEVVEVTEVEWERSEGYGKNKVTIAAITQLPLKLAWAITIHKSQGMTLDKAIIDVSRVFATGHAYVAVSRVRSLDGLFLQGRLTTGFLSVNQKVITKDKEFLAKGL